MLVILTDEQVLSPQNICRGCLLADSQGLPRWRNGKLGCCAASPNRSSPGSYPVNPHAATCTQVGCLESYECQMGFRVANIE